MSEALRRFVAGELAAPLPPGVAAMAEAVGRRLGGVAVLFYGSVLRTGDLDALLDFYVLTPAPRRGLSRHLWPDISFEEFAEAQGARTLRAKVATMPLERFAAAAAGGLADTTIWTRFVQPAALAWAADDGARAAVVDAVAAAAVTAARVAAVVGPERGAPLDYWRALFAETYRAELRVEPPGRGDTIVGHARERYAALLPLAWEAAGVPFEVEGETLSPRLDAGARRRILSAWRRRRRLGRPLNLARLVKAAFLLDGAARYGAWKVERHTGIAVAMTPFRERHPVLAAPAVLWRVWRQGRTR